MSPFFPFPLASHFDLPGSESVFGLPQGPLIGVGRDAEGDPAGLSSWRMKDGFLGFAS